MEINVEAATLIAALFILAIGIGMLIFAIYQMATLSS